MAGRLNLSPSLILTENLCPSAAYHSLRHCQMCIVSYRIVASRLVLHKKILKRENIDSFKI